MGCELETAVGEGQVRAGGLGLCQGRGQYCRLDASRKAAGRRWRRPGGAGTWSSRNPTPVCSGPCSSPVTESSFMSPPPTLQHQGRPQRLWWWLGLQKEVADCVTPREWCPQGTGSRREGADHHQNIQLPLSICPYCQVPHARQSLGFPSAWPPSWIIPTLLPSTRQLHSISGVSHCSQGTMDSHGRPGGSLACGSADTFSPPSFTSGADGAPSLGYLSSLLPA